MNDITFQTDVPLREYSTLGIGGNARYFYEARTVEEMQQAIVYCHSNKIPFIVIGKGSNCLFDDRGFDGAVLLNKIDFCNQPSPGIFEVGAGYSFAHLGVLSARQGWSGLEFASGIPATVGGAVYMNAGANGGETCNCLDSVDFINEKGVLEHFKRDQLVFRYRYSPFQERCGAIVKATFILQSGAEARKRQIEIVNARIKTQPYGSKSAGCIFLNPSCKSAGALIDQCGLKGKSVGGAAVSTLHANFLINAGNASCQNMLDLIKIVQEQVIEKTGIQLESEVRQIPYTKKMHE